MSPTLPIRDFNSDRFRHAIDYEINNVPDIFEDAEPPDPTPEFLESFGAVRDCENGIYGIRVTGDRDATLEQLRRMYPDYGIHKMGTDEIEFIT
jgi:hypothetical protein